MLPVVDEFLQVGGGNNRDGLRVAPRGAKLLEICGAAFKHGQLRRSVESNLRQLALRSCQDCARRSLRRQIDREASLLTAARTRLGPHSTPFLSLKRRQGCPENKDDCSVTVAVGITIALSVAAVGEKARRRRYWASVIARC
jgi:hypothetical protein